MYQRFALFLILALTISASALAVEWTVPLADHRSSLPDRFTVFAASKETGNVLVQIDSSLAIVDKTGAVIARYELSHAGAEADSIYVSYARARPEGFFVAVREGPGGWDSFVFLMFLSHDGKVKWRYKIASGFGLDFNSMPTNRDWWFDDEKLIGFDDNGRSNPINIARLGIYGVRWFAEGQNSALLYAADAVNQEDTLILCGLDGSLIWRKSLVALDIGRLNGVPTFQGNAIVIGYEKSDGSQHMQKLALADGRVIWTTVLADAGQSYGYAISTDNDELYQSFYSQTEPFVVRVNGIDGQILARRATSVSFSPQQMLPDGWLVRSNSDLNPQWTMLSKSDLSPLWQRPAANETAAGVSNGEVLFVGKLDSNRQVNFSTINARTGQLVGSISQRAFPGTQSSKIYEALGTSYQVATSIKPTPGVTDSFITAFEHDNGARRYDTRLADFHVDSAAVSGSAIMVADAELSDPRNSNVRLRRYDPSTETPTYQQTFSFAGEQTVQLYANEHRAVMILRGNCSTSSCANPTHRMISVEALTGIQVFNIELGAYPNFVLQNTLETIVALGNGRVRRFSATGVLIWDSALNLGGPIIGTILALDNNRAKLWAASQQPEPNGPGGLRYNLRLHLLDLTSGVELATRVIDKGGLDFPWSLTVLSDGSAVFGLRSDFQFPGDYSTRGYLFRLSGSTLLTEFEQFPSDFSLFAWRYFGQRFIEQGNELWLSRARNFGLDRSELNARGLVSTNTRLNKFTGDLIGEHWWSWTDTSLPKSQTEQWTGIISPLNVFSPMRAEENLLRRSEDFDGGNVNLVVSGPDALLTDSASTLSFEITVRNDGPAGTLVRLEWLDLSDRAYRLGTLNCLPANRCLPVRENGLPSLTLSPASSATVRVKVQGIFAELLSQHEVNRIAIAAVPAKNVMETAPENNALPIEVRFGPFVNGFEF